MPFLYVFLIVFGLALGAMATVALVLEERNGVVWWQ